MTIKRRPENTKRLFIYRHFSGSSISRTNTDPIKYIIDEGVRLARHW